MKRFSWRSLLRLKVVVPTVLSVAVLAFVLSLGDLGNVAAAIARLRPAIIVRTVALVLVYLVLKAVQFHVLLAEIDLHPPWRAFLAGYAVGEMSLTLPVGTYAQNYVLKRRAGLGFFRSSAATTAILASEGAVAFAVLAALGIPGMPWLRPALAGFGGLAAAVLLPPLVSSQVRSWLARRLESRALQRVGRPLLELLRPLRTLLRPRAVAAALVLAALYLGALALAFTEVGRGVGLAGFGLTQAATAYLFGLAVTFLVGISTQLGLVEASGLGALHAWGYATDPALAALLGFRVVWTLGIWLVCGAIVWVLRDELGGADDHPPSRAEAV